jgi:hypothetical protein
MFLYKGRVLFIEFKRAGEKPRKIQNEIHRRIRAEGFDVAVVDSILHGRDVIDNFTENSQDFP